jgi:hypothetical protein
VSQPKPSLRSNLAAFAALAALVLLPALHGAHAPAAHAAPAAAAAAVFAPAAHVDSSPKACPLCLAQAQARAAVAAPSFGYAPAEGAVATAVPLAPAAVPREPGRTSCAPRAPPFSA